MTIAGCTIPLSEFVRETPTFSLSIPLFIALAVVRHTHTLEWNANDSPSTASFLTSTASLDEDHIVCELL